MLLRNDFTHSRDTFVRVVAQIRTLYFEFNLPREQITQRHFATAIRRETTRVDASSRKSATFHATPRTNVPARTFRENHRRMWRPDLELCVPRDDDARKDARGRPRWKDEEEEKEEEEAAVVFFIAIGKVCRRKVSVYSPRRHELSPLPLSSSLLLLAPMSIPN